MIESIYIEVRAKNGKSYVIGSLYRAPNLDESGLIQHIGRTAQHTDCDKSKSELILGIDRNLDPLKSNNHTATSRFLDLILNLNLWPVITRPTRITQSSATLIDNICISKNLQQSFDSTILIDDLSEHLPIVVLLRQTNVPDKTPIEYSSHKLNDVKQIHHKLRQKDWNGILNSDDVNINFSYLTDEIEDTMNMEAPIQTVHISGK